MALAACLLGYGEVGLWLRKEAQRPGTWVKTEGNPYKRWMDDYASEWYQNAVRVGIGVSRRYLSAVGFGELMKLSDAIEECAMADSPSPARLNEWRREWEKCTRFEKAFWDMGMDLL